MTATSAERAERFSSLLTFFHKLVFPTVWLGGFGLGTALFVIKPPPGAGHPLELVAALILGAMIFSLWGFPLKKVLANESGLLVSNYRQTIFVPYEQISGVRENKLISIRPITVQLHSATAFGNSFVFMPYLAFVLFGDHPVATRLRERAEAARRGRS